MSLVAGCEASKTPPFDVSFLYQPHLSWLMRSWVDPDEDASNGIASICHADMLRLDSLVSISISTTAILFHCYIIFFAFTLNWAKGLNSLSCDHARWCFVSMVVLFSSGGGEFHSMLHGFV
jgi:hypothetical protein